MCHLKELSHRKQVQQVKQTNGWQAPQLQLVYMHELG